MLARQRQARILEEVRRAGGARVSELTLLLGVSDMTIRRDLDQLASDGAIQKVHGGAVLGSHVTEEPGFEAKSSLAQPAKQAIATRAAELIDPGTAEGAGSGLHGASLVKCVNLATVRQGRILQTIGQISATLMQKVDVCLKTALDLP